MSKDLLTPLVFLVVLVAAAFLLPWRMINWGHVTMDSPNQVVVQGSAQSDEPNKVASFYLSITSMNSDKAAAVEDLTKRTNEIIAKVREYGIADTDMKTQNMSIWQDERYNSQTGASSKGDWRASNSIEVKINDITKVQGFTDLMSSSGVDNLSGPNYTVDSTNMAGDSLLDEAVANAKTKAEQVAKASGKQLGELIYVQENATGYGVSPLMMEKGMGGGAGAEMLPGTTNISKTVTVAFELK